MQGWQHERIVKWDARQGRVLLVIQSDPATHLKKVSVAGIYNVYPETCHSCGNVTSKGPAALQWQTSLCNTAVTDD